MAWVTGGLEDRVVRNEEPALVWALVTETSAFLITTNIEQPGMAMPEWGNIPIPAKLLSQGVTDMARITDGRMSGTGFGTVVLHVGTGERGGRAAVPATGRRRGVVGRVYGVAVRGRGPFRA